MVACIMQPGAVTPSRHTLRRSPQQRRRALSVRVHVFPSDNDEAGDATQEPVAGTNGSGPVAPALPKIGYFAISDPKAEVYSRAGEAFDPTKKGGRWKPEFIWNTNWQEALKREEDLRRQQEEYRKSQAEQAGSPTAAATGVVRFGMRSLLEDPNVDLSEQLKAAGAARAASLADGQRRASPAAPRAARTASGAATSSSGQPGGEPQAPQRRRRAAAPAGASPSYALKDLPTRAEARRFQSTTRAAMRTAPTTSLAAVGQLPPEQLEELARIKAAEQAAYERLKQEFLLWTLGLGVLGYAAASSVYGTDVAASYAIGSVAGTLYLRLLSRSVDAVGSEGAAAPGAPRLLIPVILALGYNRFNELYSQQAGVTLQLLPMLVGFFTYKFAVVGRQGLQLLNDVSADIAGRRGGGGDGDAAAGAAARAEDDGGAMTLDRIFVKRVIRG